MSIFTFTNGNARQKSMWTEAVKHLLNLPEKAVPLSIDVTFVDPSEVASGENDFASTNSTYDSTEATQKVRDDAPGFGDLRDSIIAEAAALGLPFSPERFYLETSIHELGHALFSSLPQAARVQIAAMFGASSDDPDELSPPGSKWPNRIIEGIAETFKEAFLPRQFRVFPNRTNRHITYDKFPAFRALFRKGAEDIPSVGGYDHDILELDSQDMRVEWPASALFLNEFSNSYYTIYRAGYDLFTREIPEAHTFHFSFTVPQWQVVNLAEMRVEGTGLFGWRYRIRVNGVIQDKFRGVWASNGPSNPEAVEFYANWYLPASNTWDGGEGIAFPAGPWYNARHTLFVPNAIQISQEEGWTNNYTLFEDAIPLGPLPVVLSSSISVNPGDLVSIHARAIGLEWTSPGGPDFEEEAKARMGRLLPLGDELPLMPYFEPGIGGGSPIALPKTLLLPAGASSGARPHGRPVVGNYR
jgi:hypothetical protein